MGSVTDTGLRLEPLGAERPGPFAKSVPPLPGTVAEWLATSPRLSDLSTPVLTLDSAALHANADRMAAWCDDRGVGLAPHGKTTMAPVLWDLQLRTGSRGITVATPWQARVAIGFGVRWIMLANALVDPPAVRAVAAARDADPDLELLSWADSVETVEAMTAAAGSPQRPLTVVVELGAPGGRTGARSVAEAERVAAAVVASPALALGGVGGYEGALAHDPAPGSLETVRAYLDDLAALHRRLAPSYETARGVVTAGGSAYFDQVADALAALADDRTEVLLRSGAYLVHDDGFYRGISPLAREAGPPFRSAMHVWARAVSNPEPGLVLLDAGKRDVPFDEGLPEPQLLADDLGRPARPLDGTVTAVNDQHAFLRTDEPVRVGQVVRLGLSHPCTAFDKWRWIPLLSATDDPAGADPRITDLVRTYF
ncbi:alanine racemase [Pseudonocardia sp. HH130630-07]|uniref:alanine racemase n=1 Tax=Pseudonocardia sp. HH130630-07 TaxID=1690815 RepID=UPI000814DB94|nr:alanine racemase [Pseudonocardia sp. HH130630-07]ANY06081.1 amino acid deaminase [Pseudonocardia sp. HH130630-07]